MTMYAKLLGDFSQIILTFAFARFRTSTRGHFVQR